MTDPATPQQIKLASGKGQSFAYQITAVEPTPLVGDLFVKIRTADWEYLPPDMAFSDFAADVISSDGERYAQRFIDRTVWFQDLDVRKTWTLDVRGPDGVVVGTSPRLPMAVDIDVNHTRNIEVVIESLHERVVAK